MPSVDSTTWTRGYLNRDNKLNTGSNTGNVIMEDNQKGGTKPSDEWYKKTNQMISDYRAGLNKGGGYSGGGGGGYSLPEIEQPDYSAWFNTLTNIYNKLYDTQKEAIAQAQQRADNAANMGLATGLRQWKKMYADKRNGQGLSNLLNVHYNRDNQIEENQRWADDNLINAMSGRYTNLANLTGQLPNMDNNTIKKIMSNVSSFSI